MGVLSAFSITYVYFPCGVVGSQSGDDILCRPQPLLYSSTLWLHGFLQQSPLRHHQADYEPLLIQPLAGLIYARVSSLQALYTLMSVHLGNTNHRLFADARYQIFGARRKISRMSDTPSQLGQ